MFTKFGFYKEKPAPKYNASGQAAPILKMKLPPGFWILHPTLAENIEAFLNT